MDALACRWRILLHGLTLWSLAIAQPLYDLLGRQSQYLVAQQVQITEVLCLLLLVSVLVPIFPLGSICLLSSRWRKTAWLLTLTLLLTGCSVVALKPVLEPLRVAGRGVLACGLVVGVLALLHYGRYAVVRQFVTALSPAILICPLWLVLSSSGFRYLRDTTPELGPPLATRTSVVMLIFDEFPLNSLLTPDRQIDAGRFPHFATLAREATWCRNATTTHPRTADAVPALLTGCRQPRERRPTPADMPRNLFTWLGSSYRINEFETVTRLCPRSLSLHQLENPSFLARLSNLLSDTVVVQGHLLLPRDLSRHWLPPIDSTWGGFSGRVWGRPAHFRKPRHQLFQEFLASIQPSEQPTLHFLHIVLPHVPFVYLPSGRFYRLDFLNPEGLANHRWCDDVNLVTIGHQRHMLQIGYADYLLGQLVQRLKATGLYDECVLVVVADHGSSQRPGDCSRDITPENRADILRIPLFVKRPGQTQGHIDDRNVQSVDVLPSLADALGTALPWPTEGLSVFSHEPRCPEKVAQTDQGERLVYSADLDGDWGSLHRKLALFGWGTWSSLYHIGPGAEWFGQRVPATLRTHQAWSVMLDHPDHWQAIDPKSGYVPCLIAGQVRGLGNERVELAVAINGRVCGTCLSDLPHRGVRRFRVLVPEASFRAGSNTVDILTFGPWHEGKPSLERIMVLNDESQKPHRLERRRHEEVLVSSQAPEIPVQAKAVVGSIDAIQMHGSTCLLTGWAGQPNASNDWRPVSAFAVFTKQGRPLMVSHTSMERSDLAKRLGEAMRHGGFVLSISLPPGVTRSDLRVLAIGSGAASEIPWPSGASEAPRKPGRSGTW